MERVFGFPDGDVGQVLFIQEIQVAMIEAQH